MGDYNVERARPITEARQRSVNMARMGERKSFVDFEIKKNAWRVPPGSYYKTKGDKASDICQVYRKLSVSPMCRPKRH